MTTSELVKLQLAWLDEDLDQFEAEVLLQTYLEAGFGPDLAAAAVSAELHQDEMTDLRKRVEQLERTVAVLIAKLERTDGEQ